MFTALGAGLIPFGILVAASGQLWNPAFFILAGIQIVGTLISHAPCSTTLLLERRKPRPGDLGVGHIKTGGLLWLSMLVVAGFSHRFQYHLFDHNATRLGGALLIFWGHTLLGAAMAVNPFYSKTIRTYPNQTVIQTGPYAYVRHPGYIALMLQMVGSTLLLGSWPTVVLLLFMLLVIADRASEEDNYLKNMLPGYREYASRVRSGLGLGV